MGRPPWCASQVSLDLCGAPFPSEQLRTGRLQVGAYVQDAQAISVEGILYRDDAAAKEALAELEHAQATCPRGFTPSGVAGQPPVKTRFHRVPARFAPQPGGHRVTQALTQSTNAGDATDLISVFQRRGPIVVALYGVADVTNSYVARDVGGLAALRI